MSSALESSPPRGEPNAISDGSVGLEVAIEPMRSRHLRAVRQIDKKVYPRPWSIALYQQELARGTSRVYRVARVGSTIVGYGGLMIVGIDGHLTSVATDPDWHGHRIATRLMLAVFRGAVLAECEALTLEVRLSNTRAQSLYRLFGFVPAGIRNDYYTDTHEDALIMWANDVAEPDYLAKLREIESTIVGQTIWEGV